MTRPPLNDPPPLVYPSASTYLPFAPTAVPGPLPGAVLDDLYDALPEMYRAADDDSTQHHLYRWLAGIASQLGEVIATLDGIDRRMVDEGGAPGETSTLTDPTAAPAAWLPWLGQLVGVPLSVAPLSEMETRAAIIHASAGWRSGTKEAVAAAARTALTGSMYARVYDHTVSTPGDGGQWDVLVVTRESETPNPAAVLSAIVRRGAKPAGVVLRTRTFVSSWATVESKFPSWGAVEAAGSWAQIEEAGL